MLKDLKSILKINTFHARIVIMTLYFEKKFYVKFPFKLIRKLNQSIYHCEIHPDSFQDINSLASLRLPHPFLIIIHRSCRIGANCTIFQGVTIGVIESKEIKAAQLGKNIYIGCNSSILGPVKIVDDVTIGAHTLVLSDVKKSGVVFGLHNLKE
ncbi:MAG: cysE 1 [Mucilaginibacter sp.]|nr:cysE 1 [Mucilaginibacter sp.]